MAWSRLCGAAVLLLALASAPPALAQSAPFPIPVDATCTATSSTLAADTALMDATLTAAQARGYQGLREHLNDLQTVAAHAPACYPEIQQIGDRVIIRIMDDRDISVLTLALLASAARDGRALQVFNERNLYAEAFMYLGSYGVEFHNYDDALQWLDRGLALQPNNQLLLHERASALSGLGRFREAADIFQSMLNNPAITFTVDRALVYRRLGVALIDVPQLDEAEAALRQSLTLDPGNALTQNELDYINELRQGGPTRTLEQTAPLSDVDAK